MQDGDSIERKDEAKRETIEQAHLIAPHGSTEGTCITVKTKKQKQGTYTVNASEETHADLQPNNAIYTATLKQYYFTRLAPPTHIYTEPQKKRKSQLP